MAIALRSASTSQGNNTGGVTTVSVTWAQTTLAGSLLLACLGTFGAPGTITAPSGGGWSQIGTTNTNGNSSCSIWQSVNASAQSGAKTWTIANSLNVILVIMAEYTGVATSSPLDVSNTTATGSSTTPTTNSISTANANDLLWAVFCNSRSASTIAAYTTPTNSFTIESQVSAQDSVSSNILRLGFSDRIVSATGSFSTGVTSTNLAWAADIASFQAAATTGGPWPYFMTQQELPGGFYDMGLSRHRMQETPSGLFERRYSRRGSIIVPELKLAA